PVPIRIGTVAAHYEPAVVHRSRRVDESSREIQLPQPTALLQIHRPAGLDEDVTRIVDGNGGTVVFSPDQSRFVTRRVPRKCLIPPLLVVKLPDHLSGPVGR